MYRVALAEEDRRVVVLAAVAVGVLPVGEVGVEVPLVVAVVDLLEAAVDMVEVAIKLRWFWFRN
ncbi:hypothetical protein LPTSP4_16920 [Leptospira ryugenii]|uniref:Uncharacterized protein n=1 Tax=Leptospira ryugenii TaxID=1917863 RepID=A0A2P2DZV3_9LEPT|nr:hypothetical protein LPTSP4_16920 [Leptospira ryugenii]